MKRKFDIAFMIAKENMSFTNVCVLEERYSADLGEGYKNDRACSVFVTFIACDQQEGLVSNLTRSKFFRLEVMTLEMLKMSCFLYVLRLSLNKGEGMCGQLFLCCETATTWYRTRSF